MDDLVVRVKSPAMTACVTCPLCHGLLDEATTIPLCFHTFCWKCIHDLLSVKEADSCPVCNTDLGCSPINMLRPDHALQSLRDKIFPHKNKKTEISGTMPPVALPTKRKERSLSSPVTLPRVTGRRVASCHTLASPFEEHSPKSDDPSKDRLTESKPAESPNKSGEGKKFQQHSASTSSSRANRPQIYPPEIEESVLQLAQLLQQESFTKDSFSEMKMILSRFEGKVLPLDLGSACILLKTDFWHDWEEYEKAYSHREVVLQNYQSSQSHSLLEAVAIRDRQDIEVDKIQNELSMVDAEISRLQAKRESLNVSLVAAQNRAEELVMQLDKERHEQEKERGQFILPKFSATRIVIKETVRRLVLDDLDRTLDYLRFCEM